MKALMVALTFSALGVGFLTGRASLAPHAVGASAAPHLAPHLNVQLQAPDDPRELIPLVPGPGEGPGTPPGQRPGPQPEPQPGEGECTVLMFRDGQFYEIQPPEPGSGGTGPGDQPGGDNELFPIEPRPGPAPLPGLPTSPDSWRI